MSQPLAGNPSTPPAELPTAFGSSLENGPAPLHSANENQPIDIRAILRRSGRMLLASDAMALLLAFVIGGLAAWESGMLFRGNFQPLLNADTFKQFTIFAGLGGMAVLWLDTRGHYRHRLPFWEAMGHILTVALAGFVVCGFVQFAAQRSFSRLWLGLSWALFALFLLAGRNLTRRWLERCGQWRIPALLIGDGPLAEATLYALNREPGMGFTIVSCMNADALRHLTAPYAWKHLMLTHGAAHIFLALEGGELEQNHAALPVLVRERLPYSIVPPWLGLPSGTLSPHHFMLHDVLLVHDANRLDHALPCFLKRSFDLIGASLMLLCLWPLFPVCALIIRRDGNPALFRQERIGKNGRRFRCYKFRTMRPHAEKFLERYLARYPDAAEEWRQFQKLRNDVRITPFGRFLRRTSLDELPQLINVLRGEMSLVGPRPILPGQEHYYADDMVYYESVRPGISGPWQVSGRNTLTFRERVTLESCYARNWNLWMDIVILLKTLPVLFRKEQAF